MIILFDLDGTLIDSSEAIFESFYHSFDSHKHPRPPLAMIHSLVGLPLEDMFMALGVKENIPQFIQTYKEHYRTISIPKTRLLPDAFEAVNLASEFASLGVVTTKTGRYSKELLEAFGILEKFNIVIGREDVVNPKPDKEPILKALNYFQEESYNDVWMIGDTCLDIEASNNANINSIALLGGHGLEGDLRQCSKIICHNSLEAIKYLKSLQ